MAKTDMSPKAVTTRIVRTGQLRKLCLQLKAKPAAPIAPRPPAKPPAGK